MQVLYLFLIIAVVACNGAPGSSNEEAKLELFSGVAIEKDTTGVENIKVKFEPGELKDAARTFEEARGKVKKYTPLLTAVGVKLMAVFAIFFGIVTLFVTKAVVLAKLAFFVASAMGIQKLFGGASGDLSNISNKLAGFQSSQQWPSTGSGVSYNYARSSDIAQDGNDLAYKSQIPL